MVGDVSDLYDAGLTVSAPPCDTAGRMFDAIEKAAFPNVSAAREKHDREPTEEELSKPVAADLGPLIRASWQHAHLDQSDDPDAALARYMGAPHRLVKGWRKRFVESPPAEPPPASPSKAKAPRKPRKR